MSTLATAKFISWSEYQELHEIEEKMASLRSEIEQSKAFSNQYKKLVKEHNKLGKRAKYLASLA